MAEQEIKIQKFAKQRDAAGQVSDIKELTIEPEGLELGSGFSGNPSVKSHLVSVKTEKKEKKLRLALKQFSEKWSAGYSLSCYLECKALGMSVPTTYRLNKDENTILVTDLSENGKFAVESSHNLFFSVDDISLTSITNIGELGDKLYKEAVLATNGGINLSVDSLFFKFSKSTKEPELQIIFGDFERLNHGLQKDRKATNVANLFYAFQMWIKRRNNEQVKKGFEPIRNIDDILSKLEISLKNCDQDLGNVTFNRMNYL